MGDQFADIQLYTDWNLGRYAAPRTPQKTDASDNFLLEDASNLALILNDLQYRAETKQLLIDETIRYFKTANEFAG